MEIEGIIIKELGVRTGTTDNGPWAIASYVIETVGIYPKRLMFEVRDGREGRIARLGIKEGKTMRIMFDFNAREYQGKWYNTVTAWGAQDMALAPKETQENAPEGTNVATDVQSTNIPPIVEESAKETAKQDELPF